MKGRKVVRRRATPAMRIIILKYFFCFLEIIEAKGSGAGFTIFAPVHPAPRIS
jgi:hypothetical protein